VGGLASSDCHGVVLEAVDDAGLSTPDAEGGWDLATTSNFLAIYEAQNKR
jgi:hypothetical protein